jgi:hypothetical protein
VSFTFLRTRAALLAVLMTMVAACSHQTDPNAEPEPIPDPIALHVKNENFLDVNVALVVSGSPRRLGTVTGNGSGTFSIPWNVATGQLITVTATPIGGRGYATTGSLSVSPGQVIEFRVASVLRQSAVAVHDP